MLFGKNDLICSKTFLKRGECNENIFIMQDIFSALFQTSPRGSKVGALTFIKTDECKIIGHSNSEYDKNYLKIRS